MKLINSIPLLSLLIIQSVALDHTNSDHKRIVKRGYGNGQNYGGNWGQGSGGDSMRDPMKGKHLKVSSSSMMDESSVTPPIYEASMTDNGYGAAATDYAAVADSSSSSMDYGTGSTWTSSAMVSEATMIAPVSVAHQVKVGMNGLSYTPNFVTAAIGDTVVFEFYPKNHSLTQSSFATPCLHQVDSTGLSTGIDSGFMPVSSSNGSAHPLYIVTVEQLKPTWYFCAQGNHCQQGMGFAINPPTTGNTIEAYIAKAMNVSTATTTDSVAESLRTSASGLVATTSSTIDGSASISTETSTAAVSTSTGYGSGSAGNSDGFNACLQTCQTNFGQTLISSASTSSNSSSTSVTTGSTETIIAGTIDSNGSLIAGTGEVIVAPKKGDLRMVPFSIDIPVGENVTFVWGAGPHEIIQSSALEICNKSLSPDAFVSSGQQNATFRYPVTIKSDKPIWYYCGVKTHCEMGMYGVINPARATEASTSFGSWMDKYAASNSDFAKMKDDTDTMCEGTPSKNWGSMFDLSDMSDESLVVAAESVMMTRQYYFNNPAVLLAQSSADSTTSASSSPTDPYASNTFTPASSPTTSSRSAIAAPSVSSGSGMRVTGLMMILGLVVCA